MYSRSQVSSPLSPDVVAAARQGDPDALARVIAGAEPAIRRMARSQCRSNEDAEDAAQEALIILYRRLGALRTVASLSSWLFRIVRRECLRLARRPLNLLTAALRPAPAPSSEDEWFARIGNPELVAALSALTVEDREVLLFRDALDWTGSDTAAALGITLNAMKSRLNRARNRLRHALTEHDQQSRG